MNRIKNGVMVLLVVALIVAGLVIHGLQGENDRLREQTQLQREILKMASQAIDMEMRLRVIEQAKLDGDSQLIDRLSWEFVHDLPRYRNFNAQEPSYNTAFNNQ